MWAEQQSELLARLSRGERVNAAIDWAHVIEEIHDVGLSELHSCESLLAQAVLHLLKIKAWPDGPVAHWRGEAFGFLSDAQRRFAPSMRQRIRLDSLYRRALKQVNLTRIDGTSGGELPAACPYTLDDLLADELDMTKLVSLG